MAIPEDATLRAAQLKEEGNELFRKKEHVAAYAKYSEAIAFDGNNAVLYANRGACSLAMRKHIDVVIDCQEATRLDPKYLKAWIRLATSSKILERLEWSRHAFEQVVCLLTAEPLADDIALKEQCQAEISKIDVRLATGPILNICCEDHLNLQPWKKAREMRDDINAKGEELEQHTSVRLLLDARDELEKGINLLKQVRRPFFPEQEDRIIGSPGALKHLTAAAMIDSRVFPPEMPDFHARYNLQVQLEYAEYAAFWELGAHAVIAAAERMEEAAGWDDVGPALATTLRSWVLRGLFHSLQKGKAESEAAIELWSDAIEVLEWALPRCKTMCGVEEDVFQVTFLRRLRCLQIAEQIHEVFDDEERYSHEQLRLSALDIIRDLDSTESPSGIPPSHKLAFYIYPRARAHEILAHCDQALAHKASTQNNSESARKYFCEAFEQYKRAMQLYPPDDERYQSAGANALDLFLLSGAYTVRDLVIHMRANPGLLKANELWGRYHDAIDRQMRLCEAILAVQNILGQYNDGELTLDSPAVRPPTATLDMVEAFLRFRQQNHAEH
ncbi:hypothetical protein PsYK624_141970 [Phanerochaete sordida]|uniref:TPR-like protein n=1 Tax=Phanerochaete sordida TaxID=48140 RepID=A0A9P3LK39_9APHY|nr:hypothetical protein PsYK624_141970 [Phanerochaete sordida]